MGNARRRPKRLGAKLKAIRSGRDLTLEQMAELLSEHNEKLRKTDIHKYENDQREPNLMVLLRYAREGGVQLESIVDDQLSLMKRTAQDEEHKINLFKKFIPSEKKGVDQ